MFIAPPSGLINLAVSIRLGKILWKYWYSSESLTCDLDTSLHYRGLSKAESGIIPLGWQWIT